MLCSEELAQLELRSLDGRKRSKVPLSKRKTTLVQAKGGGVLFHVRGACVAPVLSLKAVSFQL
jgi:hypothetical protein